MRLPVIGYFGNETNPQWDNHIRQYGRMKAKPANQVLADNIRRLMRGHPTLSKQVALARKAGIAQSSIQRVLTAAVHPQLDVVEAIARAFQVSVADLLKEDLAGSDVSLDLAAFAALPEAEKEKAASYIRFLVAEQERQHPQSSTEQEFIRLTDLRDLTEEQLAQVMRAALRELNHNTLASHDSQHSETKPNKPRTGSRH